MTVKETGVSRETGCDNKLISAEFVKSVVGVLDIFSEPLLEFEPVVNVRLDKKTHSSLNTNCGH